MNIFYAGNIILSFEIGHRSPLIVCGLSLYDEGMKQRRYEAVVYWLNRIL